MYLRRAAFALASLVLVAGLAMYFVASASAAEIAAEGTTETAFTPWDDAEGAILRVLGEARSSIHVQAYLLTSRNIAKALLAAHERGVAVQVLADAEMVQKGENSQIPALAAAGIPVWLEVRYANAHNKLLLIDVATAHPAVVTGSYNFTWSAQARNAENVIILRDNHHLAQAYLDNWQRHQAAAETYAVGAGVGADKGERKFDKQDKQQEKQDRRNANE